MKYSVIGKSTIHCQYIWVIMSGLNKCPISPPCVDYIPSNPKFSLYYGHYSHLSDSTLKILWSHHIQVFNRKVGDSVHNQPKNNGPNLKLNNMFFEAQLNWMRNNIVPHKFPHVRNMVRFKKSIRFHHQGYIQEDTTSLPLSTWPRHEPPSLTWIWSNIRRTGRGGDIRYIKGLNCS